MYLEAMGKPKDDLSLSLSEQQKLHQHLHEIMSELQDIAPKELEAFLAVDTGHSYEQLANLIARREKKNLSEEEYEKLVGALRTRAHRGRQKVVRRIKQIYQTEKRDGERLPS